MADRVHMLCQQGGRMPEITAKYRCSGWVYNTARKIGERNAAAREAAARAEADAALAGAGILAIQTAPDASAEAGADKKVMREAADAMAQIIESSLVAHGIKVAGRVNRSINTALSKNRSSSPRRPIFMFELRTDWRLADGVVTPTAASAAPVDDVGKLQAVLAMMVQMQLDNMNAAKAGKP
jgi:hypothetical protein